MRWIAWPDIASSTVTGSTVLISIACPDAGPVRFEVLAMGRALMNGMGSVHSAGVTSFQADEHLAALWADAGRPPPVHEVDFGNRFDLSITIPDDACPPELTRFDRRERPVEG